MTTSSKYKFPNSGQSLKGEFWWSNAIFFVGVHVAACLGLYYKPPWVVSRATIWLGIAVWQLACFGVTIGYHRLYSHRAFRAALGVRIILAALGSMAFQGSIKRFTDDPVLDPYAATRGLLFSHMGWIFYKPKYEKMDTINRDDLESDPVPIALLTGFVLPIALGMLWDDPSGAFVWGGLVARLAIWHCTFLVNSLAHWDGLQPYSDENTSRGNLHAFPHDFRAGPSRLTWDPSKWIIILLHRFGLVTGLRRARNEDIRSALAWMRLHGHKHHIEYPTSDSGLQSGDESIISQSSSSSSEFEDEDSEWEGPIWDEDALRKYVAERPGRCVVLLDGYAVDVTRYLGEHPGGALLLRKYSIRTIEDGDSAEPKSATSDRAREATSAFHGGLNNHSRAARRRQRQLRVARVVLN
ncbi:uncharacterized protein FOMMEDRAFT_96016 [Fomitiporia mediterranea MF3/22]|uniref:uncharacterized protein n=1 Tax=Fomitiporia mediterranea (strain MF3/22) TaxID=694068 RepID=UPI0004408EC4|nr:uncharacterized protein FOMMEDRAFT_96016 [Fomitiporia mediterranea MF3/22]EJC98738.1 hypothetical protein FOMMEDRAFT_96016 [Fomitiporia mediterranea MF3/22]